MKRMRNGGFSTGRNSQSTDVSHAQMVENYNHLIKHTIGKFKSIKRDFRIFDRKDKIQPQLTKPNHPTPVEALSPILETVVKKKNLVDFSET